MFVIVIFENFFTNELLLINNNAFLLTINCGLKYFKSYSSYSASKLIILHTLNGACSYTGDLHTYTTQNVFLEKFYTF